MSLTTLSVPLDFETTRSHLQDRERSSETGGSSGVSSSRPWTRGGVGEHLVSIVTDGGMSHAGHRSGKRHLRFQALGGQWLVIVDFVQAVALVVPVAAAWGPVAGAVSVVRSG